MVRAVLASFTLAIMGGSFAAHADDSPHGQPVKTHKQLMNECMAKQKQANSGQSHDDMKKYCENEVQSYENHPSAPTPSAVPPT